jgi:hypothetical protein
LKQPRKSVPAQRFSAQLLSGPPAGSAVEVVERLLAVQAQDPRGARLAVRARTSGLHASDVDRALTDERSLVIDWLNRGTLHLVRPEDYWWLHALTTPPLFTANARRLAQEGVPPDDADRAVVAIVQVLTLHGPETRRRLAERVAAAGVRVKGQAIVHILMLASLRGLIVRGPMIGSEQAFALVREWLGPPPAIDRPTALAELARRYLAGHGPATDRDLARWSGLPLRDARAGLGGIAAQLIEGGDGLVDLAGRGPGEGLPPPRLLGAFEPVLLGWETREWLVGSHQALITVNGLFRPFALVQGRAAGTWRLERGHVLLEPFTQLLSSDAEALELDAADVERFLSARL